MSISDKHILITRPKHQAADLQQKLTQLGAFVHAIPVIAIEEISLGFDVVADDVIFMSANAVRCFPLKRLQAARVFAVGQATAQALHDQGVVSVIVPDEQSSEGLLQLPELTEVTGKSISLVSGESGRMLLFDTLQARGAKCHRMMVYRRLCPEDSRQPLLQLLKNETIDAVICTSVDCLMNLQKLLGEDWPKLQASKLVVISQRIADKAFELGCQSVLVAASPADEAIIETLRNENK